MNPAETELVDVKAYLRSDLHSELGTISMCRSTLYDKNEVNFMKYTTPFVRMRVGERGASPFRFCYHSSCDYLYPLYTSSVHQVVTITVTGNFSPTQWRPYIASPLKEVALLRVCRESRPINM